MPHNKNIFFLLSFFWLSISFVVAEPINENLDQKLRMKRIFVLPGYDVIKTVVTTELDKTVIATLEKYPRFEVIQNQDVIKALSPDESAYLKAAQSAAVRSEAAKITKTD